MRNSSFVSSLSAGVTAIWLHTSSMKDRNTARYLAHSFYKLKTPVVVVARKTAPVVAVRAKTTQVVAVARKTTHVVRKFSETESLKNI
jgi:hypothetical protein